MRETIAIAVQRENNLNNAQKFTYILLLAYYARQLRNR